MRNYAGAQRKPTQIKVSNDTHTNTHPHTPTHTHTQRRMKRGSKGQVDNERKAGQKEIELKRATDKEEMRVGCNGHVETL